MHYKKEMEAGGGESEKKRETISLPTYNI